MAWSVDVMGHDIKSFVDMLFTVLCCCEQNISLNRSNAIPNPNLWEFVTRTALCCGTTFTANSEQSSLGRTRQSTRMLPWG